jgi:hypothetical protein
MIMTGAADMEKTPFGKEGEIIDKGNFQRTSLNILADIISYILWN